MDYVFYHLFEDGSIVRADAHFVTDDGIFDIDFSGTSEEEDLKGELTPEFRLFVEHIFASLRELST